MDNLIYEPLKYYTSYARDAHAQNVSDHFDALLSSSKIDVEENRKWVREYEAQLEIIKKINSTITKYRVGLGFLILLIVVGFVALIVGVALLPDYMTASFILIPSGIVAVILGFVLIFKVVRPKIKSQQALKERHEKLAEGHKSQALGIMAPLNALFDDVDTFKLIEKTMPQLKFDPYYTNQKENDLIESYDYVDMTDEDTSIIDTLPGTFFENPFLYERYLEFYMGTYTYTGTRTIRWTTTYRDSKGNLRTRTHTQVLTASVTKPKPYYVVNTHLGYGCDCAPDLTFSRTESDTDELSEGALARRIKRGEKKLRKRAEKAIENGEHFQGLANSEFDVLFGATNRDHEVQFRVMYTPLAQTNTVELLKSKAGYGDDFNFYKQGRFNIIKTIHQKSWDIRPRASRYRSYSVDLARKCFQEYNENYFKSVFFDFAPLMAIPAYQAEPVPSMKKPPTYVNNYSPYEYECLANAIGESTFAHPDTSTRSILKASFIDSQDDIDRVSITAKSFKAIKRLDNIPVLGGDGRMHLVPVVWFEYIPIENQSQMLIKRLGYTERELSERNYTYPQGSAYLHGLLAYHSAIHESWSNIENTFKGYI
ncbi:MAG: hypothetical protein IJA82_03505 [Clostridia bacterium]|nr:hypothetical protein [Clostridia bacterium]